MAFVRGNWRRSLGLFMPERNNNNNNTSKAYQKEVDKHIYNLLVHHNMEQLRRIGYFDSCEVHSDQSAMYVRCEDTKADGVWGRFADMYKEIEESVVVETIQGASESFNVNLVNILQAEFKCLCISPDLTQNVLDFLCMEQDVQRIRVFVESYKSNNCDFDAVHNSRMGPTATHQNGHVVGNDNAYSSHGTGNAHTSLSKEQHPLPTGYDVGGVYRVFLHVCDIRRMHVDAIVNSANGALKHGSGVARAIKDKAGPEFDKECRMIIKDQKKVAMSTCVWTTAGELPAKHVLHTVGPRYPRVFKTASNTKDCLEKLERTFYSVLSAAESKHIGSVAIPPIGSGVYKVPVPDVVEAMYSAIMSKARSDHKHKQPLDIHLVDINPNLLEELDHRFRHTDDNTVSVRPLSATAVTDTLSRVTR